MSLVQPEKLKQATGSLRNKEGTEMRRLGIFYRCFGAVWVFVEDDLPRILPGFNFVTSSCYKLRKY